MRKPEKQGNKRKESRTSIFDRIEKIGYSVIYNKTKNGVIRGVSLSR